MNFNFVKLFTKQFVKTDFCYFLILLYNQRKRNVVLRFKTKNKNAIMINKKELKIKSRTFQMSNVTII